MCGDASIALRKQYSWKLANRHYCQGAGAAGLGILKEIPHDFISVDARIPICAARLHSPHNITIVSIYVPPNSPDSDVIDALQKITHNLEQPFIIGGDFNAAHEVWGSPKSSKA